MLAVDESRPSFPRRPKLFHRKGDKFMAALVEGHLSCTSVRGCAFAPQKWRQLIRLNQRCHPAYVDPRLGVCLRDVEEYRLVAVLWRRSVSEASPLSIITSMRRFLSALKGALLST